MDSLDYGSTCQRADGSYYGSPGGCKQGTESSLPERPKAKDPKASSGSDSLGKVHEFGLAQEIARQSGLKTNQEYEDEINGIYAKTGKESDRAKLQRVETILPENAGNILNQIEKDFPGSTVTEVIQTGKLRGDGLAKVVGIDGVSEHNNPADIVVKIKTADGTERPVGVSLKVTDTLKSQSRNNDVPASNPGSGPITSKLKVSQADNDYKKNLDSFARENGYKNKGEMNRDYKRLKKLEDSGEISSQDSKRLQRMREYEAQQRRELRDKSLDAGNKLSLEEKKAFVSGLTGSAFGPGAAMNNLKVTGYSNANSAKQSKVEDLNNLPVNRAVKEAREIIFQPKSAGDGNTMQIVDEKGNVLMELRYKGSSGVGSSLKGSVDTIFHG